VALYGIYADATDGSVTNFVNKFAVPSSVFLNKAPFNNRLAGSIVERILLNIGPLTSFDDGSNTDNSLKHKALARFADAASAKKACMQLHNQTIKELGGGQIFVQRLFKGKCCMPHSVYAVLQLQLEQSIASVEDAVQPAQLRFRVFTSATTTTISIQADEPTPIVRAKVVLSPLVQGVQVTADEDDSSPLWHADFALDENVTAVQQINNTLTGRAYLLSDLRRRELRIWGEAEACQEAAVKVRQLHAAMLCKSHVLPVSKTILRAVLRLGLLQKASELCGGTISLDTRSHELVMHGDEDMAKIALAFVTQAVSENQCTFATIPATAMCSVCYCEVENDFTLECGHHYCLVCAQTWFSATGTPGAALSFPLVCLAESCDHLVSIRDFQTALENKQFHRVARTAVDEYVNSHLERFQ
jgi:hypothetical protein